MALTRYSQFLKLQQNIRERLPKTNHILILIDAKYQNLPWFRRTNLWNPRYDFVCSMIVSQYSINYKETLRCINKIIHLASQKKITLTESTEICQINYLTQKPSTFSKCQMVFIILISSYVTFWSYYDSICIYVRKFCVNHLAIIKASRTMYNITLWRIIPCINNISPCSLHSGEDHMYHDIMAIWPCCYQISTLTDTLHCTHLTKFTSVCLA